MSNYPTFTLSRLLLAITLIGMLLALYQASIKLLESEFWRVHPAEQDIAAQILKLGGAYNTDRANDRHIIGVDLHNTNASDEDMAVILQLPFLEHLDVANSRVSDASLELIFEHKRIKTLRVAGSPISAAALKAELAKPGNRTYLDD